MALGVQRATSDRFRELLQVSARYLILILVIGNHQLHQEVQNLGQQLLNNPRRVLLYFTIDQARGFGVREWSNNFDRGDTDRVIANNLVAGNQFIFRDDIGANFQVLQVNNIALDRNNIRQFIM